MRWWWCLFVPYICTISVCVSTIKANPLSWQCFILMRYLPFAGSDIIIFIIITIIMQLFSIFLMRASVCVCVWVHFFYFVERVRWVGRCRCRCRCVSWWFISVMGMCVRLQNALNSSASSDSDSRNMLCTINALSHVRVCVSTLHKIYAASVTQTYMYTCAAATGYWQCCLHILHNDSGYAHKLG